MPAREHGEGQRDRTQGQWHRETHLVNPHTAVFTAALSLTAGGADNPGAHRQMNGDTEGGPAWAHDAA